MNTFYSEYSDISIYNVVTYLQSCTALLPTRESSYQVRRTK